MKGAPIVLAGLLLGAAPVPPAGPAAQATSQAAQATPIDAILADIQAGHLDQALAQVDLILQRPLPDEAVREMQRLRGTILLLANRREEAIAAFARAEAIDPGNPAIALYELDLAFDLSDPVLAVAALDRLIERFPDAARTAEPTKISPLIGWMRRNGQADAADALLIRLARIGFGGNDFTTRDNYAMEAAAGALRAGRIEDARALAARVHSRRELTMALTERRFSALWPAIEAQVGPRMALAEAEAVREAEDIAAAHPDDVGARHGLMQAYYLAGRFAEADRIGAGFAATPEEMRAIDEAGGWLVNDHAIVLVAMGRAADADARLAAMRAIDIETSSWLISMVINRLEYLVRDGRWPQALALQDEAARLAERHGSPYARQLVRRLQLCTLRGLGRQAEAEALLAELLAHETDSPGATIDALICLGRVAEAEPVLVRWLGRAGEESVAIDSLQPAASARVSDPSIWTQGWEQLAQRPAVRQAFERIGRVLPEAFWPRPGARG